jgi:hypothetical protein
MKPRRKLPTVYDEWAIKEALCEFVKAYQKQKIHTAGF